MSVSIRTAALTLAVVVGVLSPTAAQAERWTGTDEVGDVEGWHHDPEPEPCGTRTDLDASANTDQDITRLVVSHRRREVRLVVRFEDLDRGLEQHTSIAVRSGERHWVLTVNRFRDFDADVFQVVGFLARTKATTGEVECGPVLDLTPTDCHVRPTVDLDANAVRVDVPRSCLRHPRWVRVGARATGEAQTEAGRDLFSDVWGAGGSLSTWPPPLGARVAAPPGVKVGSVS